MVLWLFSRNPFNLEIYTENFTKKKKKDTVTEIYFKITGK